MNKQISPHVMNPPTTRREALRAIGGGFGLVGLAGALGTSLQAASVGAASPMAPKPPHFTPRANRIVYIFLSGGLSHIDSFDYKAKLAKYHGKPLPYATPLTQLAPGNLMKSPFTSKPWAQDG